MSLEYPIVTLEWSSYAQSLRRFLLQRPKNTARLLERLLIELIGKMVIQGKANNMRTPFSRYLHVI